MVARYLDYWSNIAVTRCLLTIMLLCSPAVAQEFVVTDHVAFPVAARPSEIALLRLEIEALKSELAEATAPVMSKPVVAKPIVKAVPKTVNVMMSHSEMVALHNRLHGGGSWTWPGDLATHLRNTHGTEPIKSVTKTAVVNVSPQPVRIQSSASNCPGGVCPIQPARYSGGRSRRSRR